MSGGYPSSPPARSTDPGLCDACERAVAAGSRDRTELCARIAEAYSAGQRQRLEEAQRDRAREIRGRTPTEQRDWLANIASRQCAGGRAQIERGRGNLAEAVAIAPSASGAAIDAAQEACALADGRGRTSFPRDTVGPVLRGIERALGTRIAFGIYPHRIIPGVAGTRRQVEDANAREAEVRALVGRAFEAVQRVIEYATAGGPRGSMEAEIERVFEPQTFRPRFPIVRPLNDVGMDRWLEENSNLVDRYAALANEEPGSPATIGAKRLVQTAAAYMLLQVPFETFAQDHGRALEVPVPTAASPDGATTAEEVLESLSAEEEAARRELEDYLADLSESLAEEEQEARAYFGS